MKNITTRRPALPCPTALRREITAALAIKVVLLTALWFLIFRWHGQKPAPAPDIAERFSLAYPDRPAESPAPVGPSLPRPDL